VRITNRHPSPNPVFGILTHSKKTHYGEYTKGVYRDYNIEIFDAKNYKQKLYYVSDKFLNWVKSKLVYFQNGTKHIARSERK
jgi:hypothetical protein